MKKIITQGVIKGRYLKDTVMEIIIMNRKRIDELKGTIRAIEALIEVVVLTLIYYLVWKNIYENSLFPAYYGRGKYVMMLIYALITISLFNLNDSFKFGHLKLSHIFISQIIAIFLTNVISYFQLCLIANKMVTIVPMIILFVIDIFACLLFCYVYTAIYHKVNVPRNILMIVGEDNNSKESELKFKLDSRADKYTVTKIIRIKRKNKQLFDDIDKHDAVVLNNIPLNVRNDILKYCYENHVRTYIVPEVSDIVIRGLNDITLFDTPLLLMKDYGLSLNQQILKRTMDIILSLLALIIGAPIMLIIAIAIKLEDGGPILFKQDRVTKDEKVFSIIKFRSMIIDAEKDGISIPAVDNDPRITKVGKVIRPLRLDELPQIFNILKGDMSIVGPRPERVEHVEEYSKQIPEFKYRYKVKGGLTGYAQIYGKYNTSAYDKLRMDLIYIENYSLLLDIKLIIETVRILFKKESTEGFGK